MFEFQVKKISEINELIKKALENNVLFKNIKVKGEIANLTYNKSGHIYFSLKDEESKINCAIWKSNTANFLSSNISEGTEIIATGSLSYYKPSGKITFTITYVEIDGIGQRAIEFQNRLDDLKKRGWSNEENKKHLPKIPSNIGIITAATGDAIRDLITNIKRRYKIANIYIFPTLVQGEGATLDIITKIKIANKFNKKLDVLIVGRGGGSAEDLWTFNEWPVIKAIYESSIPIITGIGHEPDFTLADYVADKRASTPTAAAEIATPLSIELIKNLNILQNNLANSLKNKLSILTSEFLLTNYSLKNNLQNKINSSINIFQNLLNSFNYNLRYKVSSFNIFLKNTRTTIIETLNLKFNTLKNDFKTRTNIFNLLNPEKPLERGYALLKQNKKIISSIDQVDQTKEIYAQLNDGKLSMQIIDIRKESENE